MKSNKLLKTLPNSSPSVEPTKTKLGTQNYEKTDIRFNDCAGEDGYRGAEMNSNEGVTVKSLEHIEKKELIFSDKSDTVEPTEEMKDKRKIR